MQRRIVIHIGLHKTATRFFQRSIFSNLDPDRYLYNPEELRGLLSHQMRNPTDEENRHRLKTHVADLLEKDGRHLVLSMPDLSGDMYCEHDNYRENLEIVKELFPDPHIVFVVRDQANWVQSAYRQSLQKGKGGPIEVFLNFYGGKFQAKVGKRVGGMRNIDPLGLRFLEIYRAYREAFGERNVLLIRYEHMRSKRDRILKRLAGELGLEELEIRRQSSTPNRSFSALAIMLFCPSALFTPKKRPRVTAPRERRPSQLERYRPVKLIKHLRRNLIRHAFDRVIYVDWDLLSRGGMREKIEEHYREENRQIEEITSGLY